jgi:hypothetical protein
MKRLLRETNDRGYKIVPSAARPYFLPSVRRTLHKCCVASIGPVASAPQRAPFCRVGRLGVGLGRLKMRFGERWNPFIVIAVTVDVGSIFRLLCLRS